MYRRLFALASVALLALACNSTNPVEPASNGSGNGSGSGSGGGSGTIVVSIKSVPSQVEVNATQGATLTVTAQQNGAAVADGTEVALTTNLGNFGVDGAGQPLQLVKKPLSGGSATVPFYGGTTMGTANILAQVGTSSAKLNVPVVAQSAPPMADFTFQISALSVIFQDVSTGTPTAWSWDFGDGATSAKQNPLHTYPFAGTFTVSLTITNADGLTSTKRQFVTVQAGDPLIASFGFAINGLTVLFADASAGTPTSYSWDFGDGKTSTAHNPSHTYAKSGTYTVTLTIANAYGVSASASQFVTVSAGTVPQADFAFVANGDDVTFTDQSSGKPTAWSWSFGDNTTSGAQNPQHHYAKDGTYNVTLTASNAAGSGSTTKSVTVSTVSAPKAAFDFQATGLHAVFADLSTGNPTSWSWDFGDGATSTSQNPSHDYAKAGSYAVALTVTNSVGSDHTTKLVTVSTSTPPVANFCYQRNGLAVIFTDFSSPTPTSWLWNFGDCNTSTTCQSAVQNPGHTYAAAGTYAVTLNATNTSGSGSVSKFVTVSASTMDTSPVCN